MKEGAFVINIGHSTVDEAMLIATQRGKPGGAALHVSAEDPLLGDSPLWELPNVLVSQHQQP